MALLILVNGEAKVINKNVLEAKEVTWGLETWPYSMQLDKIIGSNGKTYRFNIYVDEDGCNKCLRDNILASYFAHPLADLYFRSSTNVIGPAIILPYDKKVSYGMNDFKAIYDGVVADYDSESEWSLADKNAKGKLATVRLR